MTRFLDIFFSSIALLALSPILGSIALVLRFSGEGEIFFAQERIGKGNQNFSLLKFATMLKDSPNIRTGTITVKNDPRILPFGRLLRKTKINELPQLFNVLRGDMSLIGPRPLTQQTFSSYSADVQKKVASIRPGLSGIGSIIFRNEEEILSRGLDSVSIYNEQIAPYKGDLECWFVDNAGIMLYMKCVFVTLVVVTTSNSKFVWWIFPKLPTPPVLLRKDLGFLGST